jgi:hypothetical protein
MKGLSAPKGISCSGFLGAVVVDMVQINQDRRLFR